MNISLFAQNIGKAQWLALAVFIAAYLRRITAPDSKFPVTLPPAWQPVATATVGAVYAGIIAFQGGMSAGNAVLSTLVVAGAAGVADMTVVAVFGDPNKAPAWARAMVFLFDDLTGRGGTPAVPAPPAVPHIGSKRPPAASEPPKEAPMASRLGRVALGLAAIAFVVSCAELPRVAADLGQITADVIADVQKGMTPPQILADVLAKTGQEDYAVVVAIVDSILGDPHLKSENPELVAPLKALRVEAAASADAQKAARMKASGT